MQWHLIRKVEIVNDGKVYDGYHALDGAWDAATDESGVITFDSNFISFYTSAATVEATVTYETNNGETKK